MQTRSTISCMKGFEFEIGSLDIMPFEGIDNGAWMFLLFVPQEAKMGRIGLKNNNTIKNPVKFYELKLSEDRGEGG